jgi:hypothetical protein
VTGLRLYVEPMDATLVEVSPDGRVRFDDEELRLPTLQERRAIIYAATRAIDDLEELLDILQRDRTA